MQGAGEKLRRIDPTLLRQLNDRAVFELVRRQGTASRADVARFCQMSAPTASRVVANLLDAGLIEEIPSDAPNRVGRPGKYYRVGSGNVQVLGAVIDVRRSCVVSAGLDGQLRSDSANEFATPSSYDALIEELANRARQFMSRGGVGTLGMGISTPGEIDRKNQRVIFSPNLHMTNGRSPSSDLRQRLGIETVMLHETVGTCLSEQAYGAARGMNDFVMIGTYEGFGVSVVSGGRLIEGKDGMASEMGHVTVDLNGQPCGCGNRGCLETVATDPAFARAISARLHRPVEIEEIIRLTRAGSLNPTGELEKALQYLAIGVAAAINIFNPEAVLVCSRMFDVTADAFDRLRTLASARALRPLAESCQILKAEGNTQKGAIAAIIHHLTRSLGPTMG